MIRIVEVNEVDERVQRRSRSGPVISYNIPVDRVDDVIQGKVDPKDIRIPRSNDSKYISMQDANFIVKRMNELKYPYFYATWLSNPRDNVYYDFIMVIDLETGEIIYNRPYMTKDKFVTYISMVRRNRVVMKLY